MTEMNDRYSDEPLMLTLCLEEDSILVSKTIMDTLNHPKQIQMLINEEQKRLLIQACTTNDREAIVVSYGNIPQFEMSGHSLLKRIRKLTGWTDNTPRVVYGVYMPQHEVIIFDLMSALPARLQMPLAPGHSMPS